jgi:hypothetical protein
MDYAGNALEHDRFPETYILVEAESGSAELGPDYWLRVTTGAGRSPGDTPLSAMPGPTRRTS